MKALIAVAALLGSGGLLWLGQGNLLTNEAADSLEERLKEQPGPVAGDESPSPVAMVAAAALAGLTPRTALAAGLSEQDAVAALAAVDQSEARAALAQAMSTMDSLTPLIEELDRRLSTGNGRPGDAADRVAAQAALASAQQAASETRLALASAISAAVPGEKAGDWARLRSNAARRVPTAFKLFPASESEWPAIEHAFRRYEASLALETPLEPALADLLQTVAAHPSVAAAAARLEAGDAALDAAFSGVVE